MSNSPFDSITARYLSRYDRRQRTLITMRGLCWTICISIGLLFVCVLLDWLIFLPDTWRWSMSVACYVVVFIAASIFCLRPVLRSVDHRQIAVEMEDSEPTLRNRLLSAVELHAADGASAGSPRLREISQASVAAKMQSVDIKRLLPLSRLKRSGPYAALALSAVAVVVLLPGTDFRQRFARVLMPGANLGRVSQTQLSITAPSPATGVVPADETTPVTALISGLLPKAVYLQHRGNGGNERQAMHAHDDHHYAINLPVGNEPLEYRIHAGNSVTPWHTLSPKQRPSITAFKKTIRHPSYAGLEESVLTDTSGDIEALKGSTAEIELMASAPLSSAQLSVQWEDSDSQPGELEQLEPHRYRLSFPVERSGSYKLALVDADTGFDNPFLPAYRIRSVEDLPPHIELADTQREPLLLPPSDLLPFELRARDEMPLAMIGYEVSINSGQWQRKTLLPSPDDQVSRTSATGSKVAKPETVTVSHELDLLPYNLNVGDSVRLRGVATDRKRQTAETPVLEIVIDSDRYEPGTRDGLSNRLAWARAIKTWTTAVQSASETTLAELDVLLEETPEDQLQLAGNIDTSPLEFAVEESHRAIHQSISQLPNTKDPVAAAQLEHVGRMVDVVQADLRGWVAKLNDKVPPQNSPRIEQLKQLKQSMQRAADNGRHTGEYVSNFIGFDLTLAYTGDVYGLIGLLDSFQPESASHSPWRRLYRYSTVTLNRLKAFDEFVAETSNYMPARSQNLTVGLRMWLSDRMHRLNEVLDETTENDPEGKEDALRKMLVDLRRELYDKTNTASQDGQIHQKTVDGLRDLDRRAGALHQEIAVLGDKLQQVAKAEQAMLASKDAAEIEQTKGVMMLVKIDAERSANTIPVRLRRWATLHQLRPDADARYAADAGLTSRAIEAVLRLPEGSSELKNAEQEPATRDEIMKAIAGDYQILEAGHRLTDVLDHLEPLIQAERWSRNRIVRRFELPLQWDSHLKSVDSTTAALRDAKTSDQIYGPVHASRSETPVRTISQALSERRGNREADLPVFRQMQDVHKKLTAPHAALQPVMEAARQRIAAYVPSIPQLAEDAADSLQQVAATEAPPETLTSADDPLTTDDAAAPEIDANQTPQSDEAAEEAFAEQMQRLIDALVQHANLADVSTFEGIQQARDADAAVDVLKASQEALEQAQADAAAQKTAAMDEESASSPALQRTEEELNEAQQRTLDLLKMVQQHFASETAADQQPPDAAPTEEALLAALREAGLQREIDQRFESLEQMVTASEKSPQDLLQELEAELKRNPEMQAALSDISQRAVEGVRETLSKTADEQEAMQRGIESADADFRSSKTPVVQALNELADRAAEMERTLVQQAERAASRGEIAEIHQQLVQQRQQLGQIAAAARGVNEDSLMSGLRQTAEQVAGSLGEVADQLKAASDEAAEKQNAAIEEDEGKRRNLANALQDENRRMREGRIRDAENRLKGVQGQVKNAEQRVRAQENNFKQKENQVRQAQQRVNQEPENEQHKRALAQMVQQQQQSQKQLDDAKAAEQAAKEKRGRYEEAVAAAKATPQPNLNAANPAAQSARELAAHAAQLTDQLGQSARQAAEAADSDAAPAPPVNHLENAETQQHLVQQQVSDAARDLARAARHEARLDKPAPAELLAEHANRIAQTARNEVATAEDRVESARRAAGDRQQAMGAASNEPANETPQNLEDAEANARQAAVAARDSLQQSEQSLRQRQEEMEPLLAASDPSGDTPENVNSDSTSGSPDSQASSADSQGAPSNASDSPAAASNTPAGSPDAQAGPGSQTPPADSSTGQSPSVAGLQDPEVMAQTLDHLDQQIAAAGEQSSSGQPTDGQQENAPSTPSDAPLGPPTPQPTEPLAPSNLPASFASRLKSEARAQGRQLAQQRTAGQEASMAESQQPSDSPGGLVSNAAGPGSPEETAERLQPADRRGDSDWGDLKTLTIEDAADSGSDPLNRAYRSQLEAYFRVIAERSRTSTSADGS